MAFCESGPQLFVNIFFGKLFIKDNWGKVEKERNFFGKIVESIRHRFASYDTLMQLTPLVVINLIRWLIVSVFIYACYSYLNGINNLYIFGGSTFVAKLLSMLFNKPYINVEPGVKAFFISMLMAIWLRLLYRIGRYFINMWVAVYVFIIERKRIKKIPFKKKVLYTLTWPTFDIIGRYTIYLALFVKVTWKPIPHVSKVTIDEVDTSKKE